MWQEERPVVHRCSFFWPQYQIHLGFYSKCHHAIVWYSLKTFSHCRIQIFTKYKPKAQPLWAKAEGSWFSNWYFLLGLCHLVPLSLVLCLSCCHDNGVFHIMNCELPAGFMWVSGAVTFHSWSIEFLCSVELLYIYFSQVVGKKFKFRKRHKWPLVWHFIFHYSV